MCVRTGKDTTSTYTQIGMGVQFRVTQPIVLQRARQGILGLNSNENQGTTFSRKTQRTCHPDQSTPAGGKELPEAGIQSDGTSEAATSNFLLKELQHHSRALSPLRVPCSYHLLGELNTGSPLHSVNVTQRPGPAEALTDSFNSCCDSEEPQTLGEA